MMSYSVPNTFHPDILLPRESYCLLIARCNSYVAYTEIRRWHIMQESLQRDIDVPVRTIVLFQHRIQSVVHWSTDLWPRQASFRMYFG